MTASIDDEFMPKLVRFATKTSSFVPASNNIFLLFNSKRAENPKDLIYPGSAPSKSSTIIVILSS